MKTVCLCAVNGYLCVTRMAAGVEVYFRVMSSRAARNGFEIQGRNFKIRSVDLKIFGICFR